MLDESRIALKAIFGVKKDLLAELTHHEANEILVRASPKDVSIGMITRAQNTTANDPVKTIMVYPPPPEKGGIPINTEDYACLGDNQFLNDVIIDFYLKYLTLRVLNAEDRERTHVFSSFFYKRLTTRTKKPRQSRTSVEDDPKLTAAEQRHFRVKSWTKKVNIFEKDFIIIPINEHSHWFLAIICFPTLNSPVRMSDNTPVSLPKEPLKLSKVRKKPAIPEALNLKDGEASTKGAPEDPIATPGTIELDNPDDNSDRDEAEGEEEDLEQTSEDEENQSSSQDETTDTSIDLPVPKTKPKPEPTTKKKEKIIPVAIKQPCILIFDSLAGSSRTRVVATLRDYLKIEYKAKMKKERIFNKDTIKGATPKVPQQNNFYDCGLFVLQYVESFFQTPLTDYRLPLKQIKEWFPVEVVDRKREDVANLLLELMKEHNVDVESLNLPTLTFGAGDPYEEALANEEALASELAGEKLAGEEEDGEAMEYTDGADQSAGGSSEELDGSVISNSHRDVCLSGNRDSSPSELNEDPLSSEDSDQIYNSSSFSSIGASETVETADQDESPTLYSSTENILPLVSYPDSDDDVDMESPSEILPTKVHTSFQKTMKRIIVNQDNVIVSKAKKQKSENRNSRSSGSARSSLTGESLHSRHSP